MSMCKDRKRSVNASKSRPSPPRAVLTSARVGPYTVYAPARRRRTCNGPAHNRPAHHSKKNITLITHHTKNWPPGQQTSQPHRETHFASQYFACRVVGAGHSFRIAAFYLTILQDSNKTHMILYLPRLHS